MSESNWRKDLDSQRWLEAHNTGTIKIPPYAACEVVDSTFPDSIQHFGRQVLSVKRPTRDNLDKVVFNGPSPMGVPDDKGRGSGGQVTSDFPAHALFTEESGPLITDGSLGVTWGTARDSFALKRGGGGFRLLGESSIIRPKPQTSTADTDGIIRNENRGRFVRVVSFTPVYDAAFRVSLTEIPAGGVIGPLTDVYRDPASTGTGSGVTYSGSGLSFTQSGSYLVGFSCSLYSNSAPRGSQLVVGLYLDSVPTQYTAVRVQDIERDEYGLNVLTTLENVANSGPLQIAAGQSLRFINESNYPIVATPATVFAVLLMPHAVTVPSS